MRTFGPVLAMILFGVCTFGLLPATALADELGNAIRARMEKLREPGQQSAYGASLAAPPLLIELYEQNGFQPLWEDKVNRDALMEVIAESREDGLEPSDFHEDILTRLQVHAGAEFLSPGSEAALDVLFSDALIRLGFQLFYGKVHPEDLDTSWNYSRPLLAASPVDVILSALETASLRSLLDELKLEHPYYLTLKAALRSHREIASSGGWPMVTPGPSLKAGMSGQRVRELRRRLSASGDYDAARITDPLLFDAPLAAAVKRFQERHGLESDGIVGKMTLENLNVSVESRIDQIRVNLERARWVLRDLEDDFVIVNIAGFYLRLIRAGAVVWDTPVIVGTPYRKTPVFTASMSYLEFNPSWTIPPIVLKEDILPKVKADASYLDRHGFQVTDFRRQAVDAREVDWQSADPDAFPYLIVQKPGPANALGQVKFMLPNPHAVYLHDTPSRGLFKSASRTFSSGCIRIRDPFSFAELLLGGRDGWDRSQIDALIESKETTKIGLPEPMPVLLLYWTVDPDPGGGVRYYRDVYARDREVLKALNKSFGQG
jgi:murein L,D-transpeptidase YcbB/YkuD